VAQADDVGALLMAAAGDAVKALTFEVQANLIAAAPVDTGHVRRNFVQSIGVPFDGEDDGAAQAAGQAEMLSYKIGDGDTYVTNNVDYLQYLVLGSSTQAPAGWDLIAIDQAVATIQAQYDGLQLDVTSSSGVSARGAGAAAGMASAYSPFGGDE
jgi:hypothetical protein